MCKLKVFNRTIATFVPRNYVINTCRHRMRKLQRHINGFAAYGAYGLRRQYLFSIAYKLRVLRAVFFFTHAVFFPVGIPQKVGASYESPRPHGRKAGIQKDATVCDVLMYRMNKGVKP